MFIFFDFDDVLFNTKDFREDYFKLFKKAGISKKVFEECYYDPLDKSNIKTYSPVKHIERICKREGLDSLKIRNDIKDFIGNTKKYVFGDVSIFLDKFNKKNLGIVSFSKTNFQKSKIYNSEIADYFQTIKITDCLKGEEISEVLKNKKLKEVYFIDDRVEQINDVKIKNPKVLTILLRRKEGRYLDRKSRYCDYVASNMKDILKILNLKKK